MIMQYDLAAGDINAIRASRSDIPAYQDVPGGELQLGPDGKLYATFYGRPAIGVITAPDKRVPDCNFVREGVYLGGREAQQGLPNLVDYDLFAHLLDSSALRISKRVNDSIPHYGDTITYTVTVCNLSLCGDATGVVVEDRLPAGLRYVDGMDAYPHHTFDTIRIGECRSVAIRAVVTSGIPLATRITNCAAIIASEPGFGYVPLDSNCATIMVHGTDLAVAKSVDDSVAAPGGSITYSITVTNYGPEPATNVVVRDILPPGVAHVSNSIAGGTASYDPATGLLTIPSLKVGERITLTIVAKVIAEPGSLIINCAELEKLDQTDIDITNNRSCVTTGVWECGTRPEISSIDFGAVSCCGDSSATLTVTNDCAETGELRAVILPASPQFTVLLPGLPIALKNGENTALRVIFHPGAVGTFADSMRLVVLNGDSGTIDTITVPLRGAGTPLTAVATIKRDNRAYPGNIVEAPIELLSPLDCAGIQRLKIELRYDTTMVILRDGDYTPLIMHGSILDRWYVEKLENRRGDWSIIVHAPNATSPLRGTGLLLTHRLQIFLGAHRTSDLTLTVTPLDNECASIVSESGIAELDSLCGLDLRLIERVSASKLAVGPVLPNPIDGAATIRFSTIFDGDVQLDLIDMAGGATRRLIDGYLAGGTHELAMAPGAVTAGSYICRLRSGDQTVTTKIVVVR
jgi:uncharacterized repeat protein (TIGR01451 family)